ncbi:MAG: hypothetical protein RJB62_346 [Pseudomonadota bacterium]|jgi:hypothetical protein
MDCLTIEHVGEAALIALQQRLVILRAETDIVTPLGEHQ